MAKDEIVRRAVEGVQRAKAVCDDVEFSPEDAARTELDFLAEVVERAIEAGATTVNIPDTVGYAVPSQYAAAIAHLKKHVRGIDKVVISVHCHNDLGLAVANSLAAVQEGARQVECTINGLGERAGNCALEEIVMAVRTRERLLQPRRPASTRRRLYPTSRLVSHVTGIQVQRNKAIVGQNAFAHEAGIHQDGMLKERSHLRDHEPGGRRPAADGAGAGQAQRPARPAAARAATSATTSTRTQLQKVFEAFKVLADRKKNIYDADIEALAEAQIHAGDRPLLDAGGGHLQRRLGDDPVGRRSACGTRTARIHREASLGDGPVDAVFKAIERITGIEVTLRDYRVRSVTVGEDAQGEAHVEAEYNGRIVTRPGRQHRHHRGQRPGVPAGHQPHRRRARRPATASGRRRTRRREPVSA